MAVRKPPGSRDEDSEPADGSGDVHLCRAASPVGVGTALLSVVTLVAGITTPPRSGVFCRGPCVAYPYTDVAAFVPRDYWWMYPGLALALLVVVFVVCLARWAPSGHGLLAVVSVCSTAIGAAVLVVDYGVQLSVVQPALLAGQTDGLTLWSQYNPHGLFIALENIGYALLGGAMLLLGVALAQHRARAPRVVGRVLGIGGALSVALLVVLVSIYRADLDVHYEVAAVLVTWLVLTVTGTLVAVHSARTRRSAAAPEAR
ncbi:hypothetical protein [Amycolatopsis sp. NPDC021455]|uniref:hypothetical protein n=1 Tax=Amycolatopsis sp. NPDC021455 TaxID=3154901 RepID=UPI0033FD87DF